MNFDIEEAKTILKFLHHFFLKLMDTYFKLSRTPEVVKFHIQYSTFKI